MAPQNSALVFVLWFGCIWLNLRFSFLLILFYKTVNLFIEHFQPRRTGRPAIRAEPSTPTGTSTSARSTPSSKTIPAERSQTLPTSSTAKPKSPGSKTSKTWSLRPAVQRSWPKQTASPSTSILTKLRPNLRGQNWIWKVRGRKLQKLSGGLVIR